MERHNWYRFERAMRVAGASRIVRRGFTSGTVVVNQRVFASVPVVCVNDPNSSSEVQISR